MKSFLAIIICLMLTVTSGFKTLPLMSPHARFAKALLASTIGKNDNGDNGENGNIEKAISAAKSCERNGLSPGAGLPTAEEQADAAYADLINTSVIQRGLLTDDDLDELSKGGRMWEQGSTSKKSGGLLQNVRISLMLFLEGLIYKK